MSEPNKGTRHDGDGSDYEHDKWGPPPAYDECVPQNEEENATGTGMAAYPQDNKTDNSEKKRSEWTSDGKPQDNKTDNSEKKRSEWTSDAKSWSGAASAMYYDKGQEAQSASTDRDGLVPSRASADASTASPAKSPRYTPREEKGWSTIRPSPTDLMYEADFGDEPAVSSAYLKQHHWLIQDETEQAAKVKYAAEAQRKPPGSNTVAERELLGDKIRADHHTYIARRLDMGSRDEGLDSRESTLLSLEAIVGTQGKFANYQTPRELDLENLNLDGNLTRVHPSIRGSLGKIWDTARNHRPEYDARLFDTRKYGSYTETHIELFVRNTRYSAYLNAVKAAVEGLPDPSTSGGAGELDASGADAGRQFSKVVQELCDADVVTTLDSAGIPPRLGLMSGERVSWSLEVESERGC